MASTDLVLDGLASYRLARLLAQDDLLKTPRDRLWNWCKDNHHPKLAEFVTCPHCIGVWTSFAVVLVAPVLPGWRRMRRALAAAGLVSLITALVEP